MKRAQRLSALTLIAILLAAGCDAGGLGPAWRTSSTGSPEPAITSEPIPVEQSPAPPSTGEEGVAGNEPDGGPSEEVAPLAEQIEGYASRLSREEAGPKVSGEAPAQASKTTPTPADLARMQSSSGPEAPAMPPAGSAAAPPPAPGPPTINSGAPRRVSLRPVANAPVDAFPAAGPYTDVSASPKPREIESSESLAQVSPLAVELVDVRPAAAPEPAEGTEGSPPAPNQPVRETGQPQARTMVDLIAGLEQDVKRHPQHLDDQLKLRLIYLATGQDDKATGSIEGVDPVQADILSSICRAVAAAKWAIHDPAQSAAAALDAVDELRRLLGQQSPVIIPKIALVTKVASYGNYEAVDPPRFPAGRPVNVFLYAEVANFRPQPTPEGKLRTLLSEKVEVFDSSGKVIWQRAEPHIEDCTVSARRDFFIPFPIQLPAETPPGRYVIKVTIEDKLGATTDQRRMTFTIEES